MSTLFRTTQADLDAKGFKEYIQDYTKITTLTDLFDIPKGSRIRYKIKTGSRSGARGAGAHKGAPQVLYRLGGVLTYVDPELRFLRLKNPTVDPRQSPYQTNTWSVQLKDPERPTTLYYQLTPSQLQIQQLLKLQGQIERGEVVLHDNVGSSALDSVKITKLNHH